MPAMAKLVLARFIAQKFKKSPTIEIMCRFCDTTAPTKEGLLSDDKIVSNLHEQMVGRGLGINSTRQYGARRFERPHVTCVDCVRPPLPSKVNRMSDHVVPHFQNDAGVSVIEIGSQEFMCVGANPPFDHPHVFLDLGNDSEIICPYCSTLYRFAPDLKEGEARPPECVLKDKVA
jgi:uncharacterized Zn-finger protein